MKKYLALVMTAIVTVATLSGCSTGGSSSDSSSSSSDTSATSSDSGDPLNIYAFSDSWKGSADDFTAATGIPVNYQTIAYADYQTKLNSVLGTGDEPDIVFLERGFVGSYTPNDEFIDLNAQFGDQPEMQDYLKNTLPSTTAPGYYGDVLKAIGYESDVGAYFYNTQLVSQYLGINSEAEMEAAIATPEDFYGLQDKLDAEGANCKIQADMATLIDAILYDDWGGKPYVEDNTFTITKAFQDDLSLLKDLCDKQIYYTYNNETGYIAGAAENGFIGTMAPSWYMQKVEMFKQPGVWQIAKAPFQWTGGGTYIGVTKNADMDKVWKYFQTTFLNDQWLADNMDNIAFMGNPDVVDLYVQSHPDGNTYYCGEDTADLFMSSAQQISVDFPASPYDQGIGSARNTAIEGYLFNGTYSTVDETCQAFKDGVNSLYPDINVVIE